MKSIHLVQTLILALLTSTSFIQQANAHSETVANLTISYAEDGLIITASLEKKHLTYALKKEAKCLPQDMLRVCADQYVQNNIDIIINGKKRTMTQTTRRLTTNSLVITYKVKCEKTIDKIEVKSDYMLQYNDHSKVKVISKLRSDNVIYNLSARRKSITISL